MTTKEIFDAIQRKLKTDQSKLAGQRGVYEFHITGQDPAIYTMAISEGTAVFAEGPHGSPDITVTVDSNDFADLAAGRLDGVTAFMKGKLRVKGDISLAMALQSLLK